MKSNIYLIMVKHNGKYVEYDGIEYAGDLQPDKSRMNNTISYIKENGHTVKKHCIGEGDFVTLTATRPIKNS